MAAHQAPPSLGFSRQEYWSGLPFPSPIHACMLSRFSRVRLCVIPETAAHQDPPSLGFSRQEHWSGLPFPSPMLACMLSRFSRVRLCATLWTAARQAPLSTRFSRQECWSGLPFPSPISQPFCNLNFIQCFWTNTFHLSSSVYTVTPVGCPFYRFTAFSLPYTFLMLEQ